MIRDFVIILISIFLSTSVCFAETVFSVEQGIDAYKAGNYTECENNMKAVVKNDPTSSIAYYYLALSYSKQGKKILAIKNYDKVIALKSDKALVEMAKQGKLYIGGKNVVAIEAQIEDIEENAKSSVIDNTPKLNESEKKQIYEQKITSSPSKQQYSSQNNNPPTNDEIVNAIRVLQRAGILQNGMNGMQAAYPQMDAKTQQMNAMLMMMNNNNNNNNGMMNMMPYMNSSNGKMDPQMIQMMMMNQMMPNFSTDSGNKNY